MMKLSMGIIVTMGLVCLIVFYIISAVYERIDFVNYQINQVSNDIRWHEFRHKHGHVSVGDVLVDLKDSTAAVIVPGPRLVQLKKDFARAAIRGHYSKEPFKLTEDMLLR